MTKTVKVSRHGLTTCPGCACHIQLADVPKDTSCPFCGTSLLRETSPSATTRLLQASGSGLLAVALLGLPACTTAEPKPDAPVTEQPTAPAPESQPDAPPAPSDIKTEPVEPEYQDQPEYGIAAAPGTRLRW